MEKAAKQGATPSTPQERRDWLMVWALENVAKGEYQTVRAAQQALYEHFETGIGNAEVGQILKKAAEISEDKDRLAAALADISSFKAPPPEIEGRQPTNAGDMLATLQKLMRAQNIRSIELCSDGSCKIQLFK